MSPKTALVYLLRVGPAVLLNACDAGPPHPSEEPITPEIRAAIEAGDLVSLSDADLPGVLGIEEFIIDPDLAVVLCKAFFWETFAGNNGQACASCHFHAGADRRIRSTLRHRVVIFDEPW